MLVFPRSVSSTAPEATSWAKTSLPSAEYRQDEQSSATEEGLKGTAICLGLFSNQGDKTRMGLCEHGDEKEEKPHPSPEQEGHIQEADYYRDYFLSNNGTKYVLHQFHSNWWKYIHAGA